LGLSVERFKHAGRTIVTDDKRQTTPQRNG